MHELHIWQYNCLLKKWWCRANPLPDQSSNQHFLSVRQILSFNAWQVSVTTTAADKCVLPTSTCAIKPPISPEHRLRLGSGSLLHSTSQNKPLICGVFGLLDSPNFHFLWRSRVLMSSGWPDTVKTLPCPPTAWHLYLPGATVHAPFFNFECF